MSFDSKESDAPSTIFDLWDMLRSCWQDKARAPASDVGVAPTLRRLLWFIILQSARAYRTESAMHLDRNNRGLLGMNEDMIAYLQVLYHMPKRGGALEAAPLRLHSSSLHRNESLLWEWSER